MIHRVKSCDGCIPRTCPILHLVGIALLFRQTHIEQIAVVRAFKICSTNITYGKEFANVFFS